ncbi:peptidylprolyl isomerase [archaeon]|nr:peptidylprolyl isomerase [archaeon]
MVDKGTFVQIDYTGKTNGKVFDTTLQAVGEKEGFEKKKYSAMLVKTGAGELIKGIDDALLEMKEGDKKVLKIPAEKAYGQRKPELVKLVPMKVFKKNDIKPVPGMILNLDNMSARIQSVSAGRVRVDFNHELAGKDLDFDLTLTKVLKTNEEIIKAITSRSLPEAEIKVKENKCEIEIKTMGKEYPARKAFVINRILDMVEGIKKVEVEETYEKPTITLEDE